MGRSRRKTASKMRRNSTRDDDGSDSGASLSSTDIVADCLNPRRKRTKTGTMTANDLTGKFTANGRLRIVNIGAHDGDSSEDEPSGSDEVEEQFLAQRVQHAMTIDQTGGSDYDDDVQPIDSDGNWTTWYAINRQKLLDSWTQIKDTLVEEYICLLGRMDFHPISKVALSPVISEVSSKCNCVELGKHTSHTVKCFYLNGKLLYLRVYSIRA